MKIRAVKKVIPDRFVLIESEKDTGDHSEGMNKNTKSLEGVQNDNKTSMEITGECIDECHPRGKDNTLQYKITKFQEENSYLCQSIQHLKKTTKEIENQKDTVQNLNEQLIEEFQAAKIDLEKEKSQHLVQVNQLTQQLHDMSKEKYQGIQSLQQCKQRLKDITKEKEAEKTRLKNDYEKLVKLANDDLDRKNSQQKEQMNKLEDVLQMVTGQRDQLSKSVKEQDERHDEVIKEYEAEKTLVKKNHEEIVQGFLTVNSKLNYVNKQNMERINQSGHELQQVKEERDQLLKSVKEQENKTSTMKEEVLQNVLQHNVNLTKKFNDLTDKWTQIKREWDHQLSDKLSKEWSDKGGSDERHIENVSIPKRPVTIKGDYENVCSNEWLDVKGEIDDVCSEASEETKQGFLCEVFMISEEVCNKQYDKLMKITSTALPSPVKAVSSFRLKSSKRSVGVNIKLKSKDKEVQNDDNSSKLETSRESIMKSESKCERDETNMHSHQNDNKPDTTKEGNRTETPDHLRGISDNIDVTQLAHEIKSQLFTDSCLMPLMVTLQGNKCFEKYVAACANLAWNMVIQRPKMNFTRKGIDAKWDEKFQFPGYGSDDPKHPDCVVKYYRHPTLMHAEAILVKGSVITKIVQQ